MAVESRAAVEGDAQADKNNIPATNKPAPEHASGKAKYDTFTTLFRGLLWATYFNGCCIA